MIIVAAGLGISREESGNVTITMRSRNIHIHIYYTCVFHYKRLLRNYIVTSAYHSRAQSILQKPLRRRRDESFATESMEGKKEKG